MTIFVQIQDDIGKKSQNTLSFFIPIDYTIETLKTGCEDREKW